MPDSEREIETWSAAICTSVNGDFVPFGSVGVQTFPTAELAQSAALPTPALIICKSKVMVPPDVTNVANPGMVSAPDVGVPTIFPIVPLVSPRNEPVSGAPTVNVLVTSVPVE